MKHFLKVPKIVDGKYLYGTFNSRPNRFIARCAVPEVGIVEAFMPNPGRLDELLIPGIKLLLEKANLSVHRKTEYTVCGVYKDDYLIGLNTLRTNGIAEFLLENRLIPDLKNIDVLRREIPYKGSRFDFGVSVNGRNTFLEVKSVTLSGNKIAMFPDAVTARGTRHLNELQEYSIRANIETIVLFIVQGSDIDYFMPDFHTDLNFAQTMLKVRENVKFVPVQVQWNPDLSLSSIIKVLDIPWDYVELMSKDRGAYILTFDIDSDSWINVGGLGEVFFQRGSYMYVGSAMNGLSARISRHVKRRKNKRWHIDYLLDIASNIVSVPIVSATNIEFNIAKLVSDSYVPYAKGFGASDSPMDTHLFLTEPDVKKSAKFQNMIMSLRLRNPFQRLGRI